MSATDVRAVSMTPHVCRLSLSPGVPEFEVALSLLEKDAEVVCDGLGISPPDPPAAGPHWALWVLSSPRDAASEWDLL